MAVDGFVVFFGNIEVYLFEVYNFCGDPGDGTFVPVTPITGDIGVTRSLPRSDVRFHNMAGSTESRGRGQVHRPTRCGGNHDNDGSEIKDELCSCCRVF